MSLDLLIQNEPVGVLDLRNPDEFLEARLANSQNIPLEQLHSRFFCLPDRSAALAVVVQPQSRDEALRLLRDKGWTNLTSALEPSNQLWAQARNLGIFSSGPVEPVVLCKPSPFLVEAAECVEALLEPAGGPIDCCDVGCGSGRNAAYLASRNIDARWRRRFPMAHSLRPASPESAAGRAWRVLAVDALPAMLLNCAVLGCAAGVEDRLRVQCARVKGDGAVRRMPVLEKWLSEEQEALLLSCSDDGEDFHRRRYDVVVGVRFLEKTFLPQMAEMVRPGGFLVYSTFADGAQYMKGPKNLNRIVMKGELARAFGGDKGFLVLIDRIEHSEDGRPLNCFLARKLK